MTKIPGRGLEALGAFFQLAGGSIFDADQPSWRVNAAR
jgi:hypothetical protein